MATLNDEWFYTKLEDYTREKSLETEVDLTEWFNFKQGPRWRGMPESVWRGDSDLPEWKKLCRRLPKYFASEVAYLTNRSLEIARRVFPYFDTILASHAYVEWLLYANLDHGKYRDHIVHPFKVAVIARWLLEKTEKFEQIAQKLGEAGHVQNLLKKLGLSEDVFTENDYKLIKAAMWLAGLYHDLGYGHNLLCYLEKRLETSYRFYVGDVVAGSVRGIPPECIERSLLRSYLEEKGKCDTPAEGYWPPKKGAWEVALYENLPRNHSIAGALNFLCLLQEILDHWHDVDPRVILTFELAAEAIFFHDLTHKDNYFDPNLCVSFKDRPIALILILADEMQDWGRPRLQYRQVDWQNEVVVKFESDDGVAYKWANGPNVKTLQIEQRVFDSLAKIGSRIDWDGFVDIKSL